MAEVGLTPSVRIALQVSKAMLPRERSRFSKHQFTHPHLLVVLRQMHYEDLTFREAELSLGEHRECQNVRRWGCPGYPTSRPRTVSCSPAASRRPSIGPSVRDGARLRGRRGKGQQRARVALDATALTQGAVSTLFVRRTHRHGKNRCRGGTG